MRTHTHESKLWLPAPREQVFAFFSDAMNLERITPPMLRFRVLTPPPIEMKAGARIDYKLRVRGVPLRWRTRIAEWEPDTMFVDEQIKGPYRLWRHTHTFEEHNAGTTCCDYVEYAYLGAFLVHNILVKKDIERIFSYRQRTMQEIFPPVPCADAVSA